MIKRKGSHLSDPKRCCLLLEAMTTNVAQNIVRQHYEGGGSYEATMAALSKFFG